MSEQSASYGTDFQIFRQAFFPLFEALTGDLAFPNKRPLLAHYTSIEVLEQIMTSDELWFSNPLLMNDLEELRFGIIEGSQQLEIHTAIQEACGNASRSKMLIDAYRHYLNEFSNTHAFDVYALCLSEHDHRNTDGLLSMWRGYGGNGSGAAIVFDTAQITANPGSPLAVAPVTYASTSERQGQIAEILNSFARLLRQLDIPDNRLHFAAWILFERIRLFALFTKHHGFREEREWRVVYLKERDPENKMQDMLRYSISGRGIEPRLKFPVKPVAGLTSDDLSLTKLVHSIILGPTASSPLARNTVLRMLDAAGKTELRDRVFASTIPFRLR